MTAPRSVPVLCVNCGEQISRSDTFGWLHVGGWQYCDIERPAPVATPPSDPVPHGWTATQRFRSTGTPDA